MEASEASGTSVGHIGLTNVDKSTSTKAASLDTRIESHRDVCTICLSPVSERAVATPCNHLTFDLLCLLQWTQTSTTCPLCKSIVEEIHYDFRDVANFKRHVVPQATQSAAAITTENDLQASDSSDARIGEDTQCRLSGQDQMLEARKRIYQEQNFCLHVGSNRSSRYSEVTAHDFARSTELQNKARSFLRRELRIFDGVHHVSHYHNRRARSTSATLEYLVEYISAILRVHDIKAHDGRAEELVAEYIGQVNARLLLHELSAWLRSPFRSLEQWDDHVLYARVV